MGAAQVEGQAEAQADQHQPGHQDAVPASAATGIYARFFRAMLERGVALAPGPYEVAFPSMAHGDAELDHAVDVASEAVVAALSEG